MNSITRRYAFLRCFRPVFSARGSWCGSTGDFRRAGADRILVEEFNDNWDKIDRAMLGKLGKAEKIGVLHNEISNSAAGRIDLSGIDWGSYQAVVLSAADYADAAYTFTISAEGTASTRSTSSASNSSLGVVNAAPYLLIFLPLGDSSRTVRLLYIGGSAGMGTATCTFDELQGLRLGYNKSGYLFFSAAHDYTLYGIR